MDARIPVIPTLASLAVITAILAVMTVASLTTARRDSTARARSGALSALPAKVVSRGSTQLESLSNREGVHGQ